MLLDVLWIGRDGMCEIAWTSVFGGMDVEDVWTSMDGIIGSEIRFRYGMNMHDGDGMLNVILVPWMLGIQDLERQVKHI